MRDDIAKVLVTRPRAEKGYKMRPTKGMHDLESLPIAAKHKLLGQEHPTKQLNEYLAPLQRFIGRQVGRPWDKVYSEIREHVKPGNTVQEHIMQHLYQYVEVKVAKVEVTDHFPCGLAVMRERGWRGAQYPVHEGTIYVDPDDKIIKKARRKLKGPRPKSVESNWKRDQRIEASKKKIISADLHARWYDGIWYGIPLLSYRHAVLESTKQNKEGEHYTHYRPVFIVQGNEHEHWEGPWHETYWANSSGVKADLERKYGLNKIPGKPLQLSSKELKRYGLENGEIK